MGRDQKGKKIRHKEVSSESGPSLNVVSKRRRWSGSNFRPVVKGDGRWSFTLGAAETRLTGVNGWSTNNGRESQRNKEREKSSLSEREKSKMDRVWTGRESTTIEGMGSRSGGRGRKGRNLRSP